MNIFISGSFLGFTFIWKEIQKENVEEWEKKLFFGFYLYTLISVYVLFIVFYVIFIRTIEEFKIFKIRKESTISNQPPTESLKSDKDMTNTKSEGVKTEEIDCSMRNESVPISSEREEEMCEEDTSIA